MTGRTIIYGLFGITTSVLFYSKRNELIGKLWFLPFTSGCWICFVLSLLADLFLD